MKKFLLENGRPDKPVSCPRCYSLNTKFCYFNNYNVKQPRHFCRECQRYWTAGGSLRNVPVGAGRRKHKMSSSNPANLYGKAPTISICSDTDECIHVSSFKPYISSHLAACSPDGKNVQEKRHADLMPVHGSEKSRFSQSMQKLAMDRDLDSKFSMTTHGDRPDTSTLTSTRYDAGDKEKLGSPQISQKRLRELTFDRMICKMTHGHGPGTPKWTSTYVQAQENGHDNAQDHVDDDAQDDVDAHCDVQGDSHDTGAPKLLPSHDDDVHKKWPSHCAITHNMLASRQMAEHDDSTCCSSVTAALTSSSEAAEAASEPNGSSPTTHTVPSSPTTHTVPSVADKPLGLDSTSAFWGPLMWPWLWPFCLNGVNSVPAGGGISQVESTLATNLGGATSNVFTSTIGAMAASNTSHIDPAHESAAGPGVLPWPYVWSPFAWGSPWNMAWNAASITSMGIKHSHGPAKEKQGSICIPKTLRLNHPDEAARSSILSTLGVASPSHSTAGFFNAFQPRGDVFRPKATAQQAHIEYSELPQHSSTHVNPAAQARSIAFQEGI